MSFLEADVAGTKLTGYVTVEDKSLHKVSASLLPLPLVVTAIIVIVIE